MGETTYYTAGFTATSGILPGDEITFVFGTGYTVSEQVAKIVYEGDSTTTTILKVFAPAELTVGAGGAVTVAVYGITNPTEAGDYTIALRTTKDPDSVSAVVTIVAGPPAALDIGVADTVYAGDTVTLEVYLRDQYGNLAEATETVTVGVYDDDTAFDNFPDPPNPDKEWDEVTITAGNSSSTTDWTGKTAMTVTLEAVDAAGNLTNAFETVTVLPGDPDKLVLTGPTDLEVDERGTYTVSLLDEYGNDAVAGAGGLTVNLSSDPATANFYETGTNNEITQVTIPEGETSAQFDFAGEAAALYLITVSATGLADEGMQVAVGVTVLCSLVIEAPETAEVGIAVPVTILLDDQHGDPFVAPEAGVAIDLATDSDGTFYDAPGDPRDQITVADVAYGESSVTVYYVPGEDAVGEHTLDFVTDKILSNGDVVEYDWVRAERTINVGTAAAFYIAVGHDDVIAGERAEVTIRVLDRYDNGVPAPAGGRLVVLETDSPEGAFYATAESAEPITEVTIPEGSVSATVYYYDTLSWTQRAFEAGYFGDSVSADVYSSIWAFRSEGVSGHSGPVVVAPAATEAIMLDVWAQYVDAVPDRMLVQIESRIGDTDLIGIAAMLVGVVDQYGNPVPQYPQLTISVKDDSDSAFLTLDSATLSGGEWANYSWLVVTEPGTYTVTASAGGLNGAEATLPFEEPQLDIWMEDIDEETPTVEVLPDTRVEVEIYLTNLWAAWRDLTVELSVADAAYGAFYADDQSGEPITSVTIAAYSDGATVWFETDEPAGTVIAVYAGIETLGLAASQEITVAGAAPAGYTELFRGWNILSTPWALQDGKEMIDEILERPDYVEVAYGYKDGAWYLVTAADPESMELRPLEAMYVKLKGASDATFWAKTGIGLLPPQRELPAGWNLVGNPDDDFVGAMDALASVHGQWAIVISPGGVEDQAAWVYTAVGDPFGMYQEILEPYRGYWVYMTEAGTLTGLAFPPVQ